MVGGAADKKVRAPVSQFAECALASWAILWHRKDMSAAELKQLLHATPFRPFTVYLASNKAFAVMHTDFAALSPAGRNLVVFRSDDDAFDILDVPLIARVEVHEAPVTHS
jgi:hypothetical protein